MLDNWGDCQNFKPGGANSAGDNALANGNVQCAVPEIILGSYFSETVVANAQKPAYSDSH